MKKKISLLYCLYAVIIITIISLFLVFGAKKQESVIEGGNSNITQTKDEDQSKSVEQDNITYANLFLLNCPRTLTMSVNEKVKLDDNFISVEPSECIKNLTIEINPKSENNEDGLTISNFILSASKVGTYNLKFSVPKSKNQNLTEYILVSVEQDFSNRIELLTDNIEQYQAVSLTDLFDCNSAYNMKIVENNTIKVSNGELIGLEIGKATIDLELTNGYFIHVLSVEINVTKKPKYEIVIINEQQVFYTTKKTITLQYEIKDETEQNVNQQVIVEIEGNASCVVTAPLIKFSFTNYGEANIKIYCKQDNSVFKTIKIVYQK